MLEAVDGADNVSAAILDCLDVNECDAAQAVRPLDVYFLLAHGNAGAQHICHGALIRLAGEEYELRDRMLQKACGSFVLMVAGELPVILKSKSLTASKRYSPGIRIAPSR